ncbi:MAG: hypothetical protein ACOCXM_02885 [Myxococcota bacterium]
MDVRETMERARHWALQTADNGRQAYENLNQRERKLVTILGGVLVVVVVLLPLYLMSSAISDLEEENLAITEVLRDIDRARPMLRQRDAEREAAMRLYEKKAPPLGSFLEEMAGKQGITIREVNDQPEKELGKYRRRHVRVTLPNVGLAEVVRMMAAIENSPYPVAIERLHIDHFRTGDRYNVQLGVVAYDREGVGGAETAGASAEGPATGRNRRRRPGSAGGGRR